MHKTDAVFSFMDFLKSFLPKKSWTPKIAMFGPGLESDHTSGLVRKLLYDDNRYMERIGLVSGQFEGRYFVNCLAWKIQREKQIVNEKFKITLYCYTKGEVII